MIRSQHLCFNHCLARWTVVSFIDPSFANGVWFPLCGRAHSFDCRRFLCFLRLRRARLQRLRETTRTVHVPSVPRDGGNSRHLHYSEMLQKRISFYFTWNKFLWTLSGLVYFFLSIHFTFIFIFYFWSNLTVGRATKYAASRRLATSQLEPVSHLYICFFLYV